MSWTPLTRKNARIGAKVIINHTKGVISGLSKNSCHIAIGQNDYEVPLRDNPKLGTMPYRVWED